MPQDMPPTGGYEPVQYKRNLPARGFRPATYLLMVGAICSYGFWRVGQGIREQKYAFILDLEHHHPQSPENPIVARKRAGRDT
ncbi:unnamed protein product [Aureobasidium vineae]|uniref:NADH dehydrogenase [ubiquinone] 1 alpha subcomplex subunit 13 n=1 Tax=Aureobasidium vineae TaxID=2773715 RepID=A0A9N8JBD2_9PEZI|nr:unnamed protein product [Aureobasidium vineae]